MDTWLAIAEERRQLASDLSDVDGAGWTATTPCGSWTVRELVAHLQQMPSVLRSATGVLRHRGNVDAFIETEAQRLAALWTDEELRRGLAAWADVRRLPPGGKPVSQLLEVIVHGRDIRSALGLETPSRPDDRYPPVLDFAVSSGSVWRGKGRAKGLRWTSTDTDWTSGDGPLVEGPSELLLWAMLGRRGALSGLEGDGVRVLQDRTSG